MGSLGIVGRVGWRLAGGRRRPLQGLAPSPGTLVGIYRARNAAYVRALVTGLSGLGWQARFWSLDEVAKGLADITVGVGLGTRTELLNRLVIDLDGPILVCDDDVEFVEGMSSLLALVMVLDLDLAQPAMTWDSQFSHPITACRPWLVARETTFVEIGPVLYVSERARDVVFPMDESYGMGWGLELLWHDAIVGGRLRAGIIDAAPVRHRGQVGGGYAKDREISLLEKRLADRGLRSIRDIQHTTKRIWRLPISLP